MLLYNPSEVDWTFNGNITQYYAQLYTTIGNPPPLLFFVTCNPFMASNNKVLLSFYRRYLAMNVDCDGAQQAV